MMTETRCDWVKRELAEVRRGRASAEAAGRVEAHLAECAHCRADAAFDSRLPSLLNEMPASAADLQRRVLRLARQRRWLRGAAIGVAAAAVIGVVSLALFEGQGTAPTRHGSTESAQAPAPTETVVIKELTGVLASSPVADLQTDRRQELFLAELEVLAMGDKR
jgi:hypothetical protein